MAPPISHFVNVNVTLTGAASEKFGFGRLMGVFDHAVTANRQDGPYTTLAEVVAAGFTAGAAAEVNAWATAVFAQSQNVDEVLIGREDVGDANWTATMTAVEAADPGSFYILNAETRTEADILLIAAWAEAIDPVRIYIAQSSDAAILAGTPGNVALDLQAAAYNRTALIYHVTDAGLSPNGYLDGAWSSYCGGFNLDTPNGAGIWMYNQLSGVTYDEELPTEIGEVYDAGANFFGRTKSLNFTSKGTMASGRFIDVTTSIDWLGERVEEAILDAFVGASTKIAYTNAGIAKVVAAVQGVLAQGVSFGHLSGDTPPVLTPPRVEDISSATKATRILTLTASAMLAGAIQQVVLNITVTT